ncbi:proline and serine-rich protein 3 isoform X2 [Seriola lalandi dorsalis]|uniref:proline and serine-rich protein 3 isoform X2 n=1 Tax=Seriola lalandi dorsalis TaxID=1841481 RepID=UPI000C6FC527|nr:proline and serine-rich protein 3 isoform X2 [Seriola lalandi dorsalis]
MKSSGSLFTRQNPFQPASRVGNAHYHPSCNQSLSKKQKKTTLSPVHSNPQSSPQLHSLSPENQQPSNRRDPHFAAPDGQHLFSESWPTTDCRSSPATSSDMEIPEQSARAGKSTTSSELGVQQDSVLAKYIERFRHGRPQSREARQQMASAIGEEQLPFWWMSPSSLPPSSTPTKTADTDLRDDHMPAIFSPAGQHRRDRSPSPCRGSLSILSDTSLGEFDDTEILHLQERASRLLLRDACILSDGSIPVSSEGLGCSDFSSPVSVDEPVRRPLIPSLIKSTTVQARSRSNSAQKSVLPSLVPPTRPEEDILFQWRLRRKMEQAREWPQPLNHSSHQSTAFSWQAPSLSHPSTAGQAYKQQQSTPPPELTQRNTHPHVIAPQPEVKEAHRSCPPASGPPPSPVYVVSGSSVSQPQSVAHVPAHTHLLCDVLPCPIQSSHARAQQNISQRLDESHTKVVSKKTQIPGNSADIMTDEPIREHISSSTCASSGAIEEEWPLHNRRFESNKKEKAQRKESEKTEKKTATSIRRQKKSTRYTVDKQHTDGPSCTKRSSPRQRLPKKVMPLAEQQQQEGSQSFSSESCTGDYAPPPSPIHSALGQVVSEVLFSTVDSSPAQRSPVTLASPPCAASASAPPQSTVPPCNTQNSMEVISQLLQEAEDSDEKEFDDDPLLQVLRKQRKWVKEQISEVDSMLNEVVDEQQFT